MKMSTAAQGTKWSLSHAERSAPSSTTMSEMLYYQSAELTSTKRISHNTRENRLNIMNNSGLETKYTEEGMTRHLMKYRTSI